MTNQEKIAEKLGQLYDLADKIYAEGLQQKYINTEFANDAAQITAILNGINDLSEVKFLKEPI